MCYFMLQPSAALPETPPWARVLHMRKAQSSLLQPPSLGQGLALAGFSRTPVQGADPQNLSFTSIQNKPPRESCSCKSMKSLPLQVVLLRYFG